MIATPGKNSHVPEYRSGLSRQAPSGSWYHLRAWWDEVGTLLIVFHFFSIFTISMEASQHSTGHASSRSTVIGLRYG